MVDTNVLGRIAIARENDACRCHRSHSDQWSQRSDAYRLAKFAIHLPFMP